MAGSREPPRHDKPSIKYRCAPLHGASFELNGFDVKDYVTTSENNKKSITPELRSSEMLTTRELISAIGSVWDCATRPLSVLLPKSSHRYDDNCLKKHNVFSYSSEERQCIEFEGADNQNHPINLSSNSDSLPVLHPKLKYLKVVDKISFTESSSGTYLLIRRLLQGSRNMCRESLQEKSFSNVGMPFELEKIYGWMSEMMLVNPKCQVDFAAMQKHGSGDSYIGSNISDPASCHRYVDESRDVDKLSVGNADCHTVNTKLAFPLSDTVRDIEACVSRIPSTELHADCLVSLIPYCGSDFETSETLVTSDVQENKMNQQTEFVIEKNSEVETCLPVKEKPHSMLARQEHAFAGGMAGIFVSMCLHPVDTIKTVVQSCPANQKSLHDISRSIISERGMMGLYRGISTNIASSAPISAVYTYTYESVKGSLLPFFPGSINLWPTALQGGASVATSFIFTPSERIKQQMQVGSRYQNCWNALVGIIEKGGVPSLYAGWGAVLCRNIPHSIIKFYMYESLKELLSPVISNGQTNTLVTLVSGGLAGSTAALFTTPFDVVKTRLQTQNPGSMIQYHGVFDTLREVAKNEGLKGLYRGLTPRLFMYMTQGALFFASYESFKRLFFSDASEIRVQDKVAEKQSAKDYSSCNLHQDEDSIICMLVN